MFPVACGAFATLGTCFWRWQDVGHTLPILFAFFSKEKFRTSKLVPSGNHLAKLQIHPIFMIHQGIFGVENSNKGNYPMTSLEFTQILVISKKKKKVSGARTTRAPPFIVNCQEIYLSKPEKTMKTLYFFVAKNKQTSVFFSNIWKVVLSERIPL